MATQRRRLRAADLPEIPVEDPLVSGYELVDGELVPVTAAYAPHGRLVLELGSILEGFARERKLGAVFVDPWVRLRLVHDPELVRAPDIVFLSAEKLRASGGVPRGMIEVVPDLAVEIFSPTNERKRRDFDRRIRDYLDASIPVIWVIYESSRYATVYHPDGSARLIREHESLDGESVLPGFTLPLATLFEALEVP
ncbi:MAG: Uma2 family endonuclease [Gemmatimonadetes bacterium]|nr:Uma2 family endonuclease [Gemmatimonadota bacterium]